MLATASMRSLPPVSLQVGPRGRECGGEIRAISTTQRCYSCLNSFDRETVAEIAKPSPASQKSLDEVMKHRKIGRAFVGFLVGRLQGMIKYVTKSQVKTYIAAVNTVVNGVDTMDPRTLLKPGLVRHLNVVGYLQYERAIKDIFQPGPAFPLVSHFHVLSNSMHPSYAYLV